MASSQIIFKKGKIYDFTNVQEGKEVQAGSFVKLKLGIGKGKKLYDKRQDLAKKDAQRQIEIQMKNRN